MIEFNKHIFYYAEVSPTPVANVAWDKPLLEWKKCFHNTSGPLTATHIKSTPNYPPAERSYLACNMWRAMRNDSRPAINVCARTRTRPLPPAAAESPIPETPVTDCSHLPKSDIAVASLGWFGCFQLHSSWADHNDEDPQWCARALPANGGASYIFHLYDPFHNMVGYMVKPVPVDFPGTCNRHRSAATLEVKVKFTNVLEVLPQPGRTVEEEWSRVEQDVVSGVASLDHLNYTAAYLRSTARGRQARVDWELRVQLRHKDALLANLAAMRDKVAIGRPIRGLYASSSLKLGSRGIKVLRMDPPTVTEERALTPWNIQLDYRVSDIHSPKFDFSQIPDLAAPTNVTTKGQQLIDALFSHQALTYPDARDIRCM